MLSSTELAYPPRRSGLDRIGYDPLGNAHVVKESNPNEVLQTNVRREEVEDACRRADIEAEKLLENPRPSPNEGVSAPRDRWDELAEIFEELFGEDRVVGRYPLP